MKQLTQPLYTAGVASNLVGVSVATLRRWEALGLVTPVREGPSRRRLYAWRDIERLQQIRYLVTRKRVPLKEVKLHLRVMATRPVALAEQPHPGGKGAPLAPRIAFAIPR